MQEFVFVYGGLTGSGDAHPVHVEIVVRAADRDEAVSRAKRSLRQAARDQGLGDDARNPELVLQAGDVRVVCVVNPEALDDMDVEVP